MQATSSKPNNAGQKRIFENRFLEALTRTHISVPLTLFSVVSTGLIAYGLYYSLVSVPQTAALFVVGMLMFTLLEYVMHRYVFHMATDTDLKKKIQYNFHGVHHDFPKDKYRLAMPPVVSVVLLVIFFGLYYAIMGNWVFGFLPGFVMGYAGYLFVHYIVHAWRPPKNVFKTLWVHHGIHHYKDPERAFGVSSPLWDFVFGTMPRR